MRGGFWLGYPGWLAIRFGVGWMDGWNGGEFGGWKGGLLIFGEVMGNRARGRLSCWQIGRSFYRNG